MHQKKGKFIVLYGINNLGKSTQAKLLVDRLKAEGYQAEYLKYPIYDLEPSGPIINNFLRGGNPYNLSRRDAQFMYALNRTQYEEILVKKLESGINIISEDYTGTGLSWGIGSGIDEHFMRNINNHLLKEDLAFLFDGKRFEEAVEKNHKFETDNALTEKVRQTHLRLGAELGWIKIDANRSIDQISKIIWNRVMETINPPVNDETAPISAVQKNLWVEETAFEAGETIKLEFNEMITEQPSDIPTSRDEKKISGDTIDSLVVERLSPAAKLPARAHPSDAGLDLFSLDFYSLEPGEKATLRTGIRLEIPAGYAGLIWDKSSLSKQGLVTSGGVIDAGYRGEILVNVINLGKTAIQIEHGQKLAQLLLQKIELPKIIEGSVDKNSERGVGGFGSSGMF